MNWSRITGYITPEIIQADRGQWAAGWLQRAEQAQRNGNELVVLEVEKKELFSETIWESAYGTDEPFI